MAVVSLYERIPKVWTQLQQDRRQTFRENVKRHAIYKHQTSIARHVNLKPENFYI